MYNDITIEQKEENKSNNNSKGEEDEEIGKVINKNNDAQSEEIYGCPLLNVNTNKVIGFHKQFFVMDDISQGILLEDIVKDFNKKILEILS